MGLYKNILAGLLAGGAYCSALAGPAVPDSSYLREIRHVREMNPWLEGKNTAGLMTIADPELFEVRIYADRGKGGWVDYYESPDSFRTGAQAESFYPFSPSIVLYGKVEYSSFTGKDMGGSCFIDPTSTPFDMVEYTNDRRGTKKLETYDLKGGAAAELSRRLSIGAEVSYTSANYSKQKDLRHVNELLDLSVAAGLLYKPHPDFHIGADYGYRRRVEGISFDTYSQSDEIFYTLVDYGAFFGSREAFGENGYTKENEDKPLIDEYHGGALQADWRLSGDVRLFGEAGYQWRSGRYGTESPSGVVYSEHGAGILSWRAALSVRRGKNRHLFMLSYNREKLHNSENIYRYENEAGGKTYVAYYGSLDVAERVGRIASIGHVAYWGEKHGAPVWITRMSLDHRQRNRTASRHPYYRIQRLHASTIRLSAERNITDGRNDYNLSLGGRYGFGGGDRSIDGTYATPSADQTAPGTTDTFLLHEFEYLTAGQVRGEFAFQYGRRVGSRGWRLFGTLHYGFTRALETEYLTGDSRHDIRLALGCAF